VGCVSFLLRAASSVEPFAALLGSSWSQLGVGGVVGRRRVWGWFPPVA
jgi:hypothetical protein